MDTTSFLQTPCSARWSARCRRGRAATPAASALRSTVASLKKLASRRNRLATVHGAPAAGAPSAVQHPRPPLGPLVPASAALLDQVRDAHAPIEARGPRRGGGDDQRRVRRRGYVDLARPLEERRQPWPPGRKLRICSAAGAARGKNMQTTTLCSILFCSVLICSVLFCPVCAAVVVVVVVVVVVAVAAVVVVVVGGGQSHQPTSGAGAACIGGRRDR
eukprot:gene2783-biopygen17077